MPSRSQYWIVSFLAILIFILSLVCGYVYIANYDKYPTRLNGPLEYMSTSKVIFAYHKALTLAYTQVKQPEIDVNIVRSSTQQFAELANSLKSPMLINAGREINPDFPDQVNSLSNAANNVAKVAATLNERDQSTLGKIIDELRDARRIVSAINLTARRKDESVSTSTHILWVSNRDTLNTIVIGLFVSFTVLVALVVTWWRQQANLVQERSQRLKSAELATQFAESAARAKSQFLASVSHDLRSPLQAIVGATGLLEVSSSVTDRRRHTAVLRDSAYQLTRLIDDLVDLSKLENQQLRLVSIPFSLIEWASSNVEPYRSQAVRKGLNFEFHAENLPDVVNFDRARLSQMVGNLLSNAIKFTDHGSVSLNLDFANSDVDGEGMLTATVFDTGSGIPLEEQPRIFDPFTQLRVTDHPRDGMGLGLAIVHRLCKLAGGTVELVSTPGLGSTFTLHVPIRLGIDESGGARVVLTPSEISNEESTPPLSILLVDDDPTIRLILAAVIEDLGYQCESAENGEEALQKARLCNYQVIVTDLQMPVMDGFTLAKSLRAEFTPCPLIIAITAYTTTLHQDEGGALFDFFLDKPFSPDQLDSVLRMPAAAGVVTNKRL